MGVEPKMGGTLPKWMVKIMENPIKMDDLGGFYHPYFWFNTHIYPPGNHHISPFPARPART